jgi:glycerol-3-phosphate dehydrogenase
MIHQLPKMSSKLLLNAQASIECAPIVAQIMAQELHYDQGWIEDHVREYRAIAAGYLLTDPSAISALAL